MTALVPPLAPMEARLVDALPEGKQWRYEPKWDGFRCLAFKDGSDVELQSKAQKPLGRYFPELAAAVRGLGTKRAVLDGEILVPVGNVLSFDDLLQRIHPAASRIQRLAAETPAFYVAFDLLGDARGRSLLDLPLDERRGRLESVAERFDGKTLRLSPSTIDLAVARRWLSGAGGSLDGVIAKRRDRPYEPGERAMRKVKVIRSADCVVGGFRYGKDGRLVGSLLLGLHDDEGRLHHVGFTSGLTQAEKPALTKRLEALISPPGFTGDAPGGPSRWSTERSEAWEPLAPDLVVEVAYDHFTGDRFRHGTRLLRWRPDKPPEECTLDQVERRGVEYGRVLE